MPAGRTYTPIAVASSVGGATSVAFNSIPTNYTDLILVINGTTAGNDTIGLRFNSDSGSNYSYTGMFGTTSTAGSQRGSNETFSRLGAFYATQSTIIANIMNRSNTSTFKTVISRGSNASNQTNSFVTMWRNTAAITNLTVNTIFGNFNSGTIITLYGIEAA